MLLYRSIVKKDTGLTEVYYCALLYDVKVHSINLHFFLREKNEPNPFKIPRALTGYSRPVVSNGCPQGYARNSNCMKSYKDHQLS